MLKKKVSVYICADDVSLFLPPPRSLKRPLVSFANQARDNKLAAFERDRISDVESLDSFLQRVCFVRHFSRSVPSSNV